MIIRSVEQELEKNWTWKGIWKIKERELDLKDILSDVYQTLKTQQIPEHVNHLFFSNLSKLGIQA